VTKGGAVKVWWCLAIKREGGWAKESGAGRGTAIWPNRLPSRWGQGLDVGTRGKKYNVRCLRPQIRYAQMGQRKKTIKMVGGVQLCKISWRSFDGGQTFLGLERDSWNYPLKTRDPWNGDAHGGI